MIRTAATHERERATARVNECLEATGYGWREAYRMLQDRGHTDLANLLALAAVQPLGWALPLSIAIDTDDTWESVLHLTRLILCDELGDPRPAPEPVRLVIPDNPVLPDQIRSAIKTCYASGEHAFQKITVVTEVPECPEDNDILLTSEQPGDPLTHWITVEAADHEGPLALPGWCHEDERTSAGSSLSVMDFIDRLRAATWYPML